MADYTPVVEPAFPTATDMLQVSDKDIDVVSSALQCILAHQKQSVKKSSNLLNKVINQDDLSEDVKLMLTDATQILQALNSQSVENNELLYAEKKMMLSKAALNKSVMQLELNTLLRKNERINTRVAELQQEIHLVKQRCKELNEQHEKKTAQKEFLMDEVEENKKTEQLLKDEIQSLAITDMMDNEELKEKVEYMRQTRSECAALQAEIDKYRDLPPNLAKAKEGLKQTKEEYQEVCKRLSSQVNRQKKRKPGRMQ